MAACSGLFPHFMKTIRLIRNKIKRLIRENYRLLEKDISVGYDIIFLWKKNKNISEANFFTIKKDIIKTLCKSNLVKKDED